MSIWAEKTMKTVTYVAVPEPAPAAPTPLRLLDQVRARIRVLHYSIRTEQTHVDWIKRYIRFYDKRHPRELGGACRGVLEPSGFSIVWSRDHTQSL
jgi:Phage integrase, N-terminal SAM-like domain